MKTIRTQRLYLQLAGSTTQGKTLELLAADEVGEVDDKAPYPLATIIADEKDEKLFLQFYVAEGAVEIPINELKKALDLADGEVHSEKWYEDNVYGDT